MKKHNFSAGPSILPKDVIQKSADNADHSDAKASPMTQTGGANFNTTRGSNIAKGGADEKGRPAPTAQKTAGEFANAGGKDSRKMNLQGPLLKAIRTHTRAW